MICINRDALVKVWLNPNLSKIYPEFYSFNQNFTETDFIYKLLHVCESLIDFEPIQEKFSDFLKKCYLGTDLTLKKSNENELCQDSKLAEYLNRYIERNQIPAIKNLLSFDKVIEFFKGYLNKHNLVIAR